MAKHAKKKQKTSKTTYQNAADPSARLNLLLDDSTKDDEERRLESALFGVKYHPGGSGKGKGKALIDLDNDDEGIITEEDGGRALAHLEDTDLFFVDDGEDDVVPVIGDDKDAFESVAEGSERGSSDDESMSSSSVREEASASSTLLSKLKSSKNPAAWTDIDDVAAQGGVSLLKGHSRLRKLRQAVDEDVIDTRDYETRLRRQFESINPEPEWAKKAKSVAKAKKQDLDLLSDSDIEVDDEMSRVFADSRRTRKGEVKLPRDTLNIERLRDVNQATQNSGSGEVRVAAFHPNPSASILCVATADRRIRLFNVDGHLSPLLTTLHFPNLPMTSSSAALFHPSGQSLLVSGPRPFFYTYDLHSGTSQHHARGLWGTTFNNFTDGTAVLQRRRKRGANGETGGRGDAESMSLTSFSPHGDMLAVAGRGGYVHLVDWKSGAGQVIGSLKCSGAVGSASAGGINGMWWVPPTLSDGALGALGAGAHGSHSSNSKLAVLTGDSEVYIWDVAERKCIQRWQDEGGFRGAARVLAGTTKGSGYMAIGSNTGYVNLYGSGSYSALNERAPKPLKSISNLTTPISTARFNHDAQILAIASKDRRDALRMIHLPSQTAFSNWPTSGTPLGHVTAIDFSPQSEYVAIGNTRGRVLLYHMKDYGVW